MKTAEEFLEAFHEIERFCKRKLHLTRHETFSFMILELDRQGYSIVRRFRDDLLEFAELRNAIVHSRKKEEVIAYPTEAAVKDIHRIRTELLHPPLAKTLFGKQVRTLSTGDSLATALRVMKEYNISQIPVLQEKEVVEVINGNTIARWLSHQDIISTEETRLEELLYRVERKQNFKIISDKKDVYACAELFADSLHKGWYIDALLMTHSGKNGEGLTGIVVLEDIATFLP